MVFGVPLWCMRWQGSCAQRTGPSITPGPFLATFPQGRETARALFLCNFVKLHLLFFVRFCPVTGSHRFA